jgi:hypothetical protein
MILKVRALIGKDNYIGSKEIEDDFPHLPLMFIVLEKTKETILENIKKSNF